MTADLAVLALFIGAAIGLIPGFLAGRVTSIRREMTAVPDSVPSEKSDRLPLPVGDKCTSNHEADEDWISIKDEKPEGVVLAGIDSYDCGWVMDTAWFSKEEGCWYITGTIQAQRAHLDYTHWRHRPADPKFIKTSDTALR